VQILNRDGLEEILEDPQLDGALSVLELVVAAKDDDPGRGQALSDDLAELQTIHERHPDVRNQDVGPDRLEERQGDLAIRGFAAEFEAAGLPVHGIPNPFADGDLVLDEENLVRHGCSPSSLDRECDRATRSSLFQYNQMQPSVNPLPARVSDANGSTDKHPERSDRRGRSRRMRS